MIPSFSFRRCSNNLKQYKTWVSLLKKTIPRNVAKEEKLLSTSKLPEHTAPLLQLALNKGNPPYALLQLTVNKALQKLQSVQPSPMPQPQAHRYSSPSPIQLWFKPQVPIPPCLPAEGCVQPPSDGAQKQNWRRETNPFRSQLQREDDMTCAFYKTNQRANLGQFFICSFPSPSQDWSPLTALFIPP